MDEEKVALHRLGKRELGPYAFEEHHPAKVAFALKRGHPSNFLPGVIPKLAELLEHQDDVEVAYLCTVNVDQVSKVAGEGSHFCGYHNIQMLCSALQVSGHDTPKRPSIPQLQDMIENAWDRGFNSHGKVLTGGIKGTRKHIGTSEAEALLLSMGISCTGHVFRGRTARFDLLNAIQKYFSANLAKPARINRTNLMPVFLQRPGHSITIVGFARSKSGKLRILAFDPAWNPPSKMKADLRESDCSGLAGKLLLKRYLKSQKYLKRYGSFEILQINMPG